MLKSVTIINKLSRLRFPWPVKLLVTAAVIYLVNRSLTKEQFSALFKEISIVHVGSAFLLGCAGFYFQVKRWHSILRLYGIPVPMKAAFRTMLWGCLLAFLTPGRTGEFFRGFSLPAFKKKDAVVAVLVEKLFAGGTTLLFGLFCCGLFLASKAAVWWGHTIIISGSAAAIVAAVGVFALRKTAVVKRALERLPVLSLRQAAVLVTYSVVIQGLLLAQTALLLRMFGSDSLIDNALAAGQAYGFMLFFPFFIANMGIREYSFGMFLGHSQTVLPATGVSTAALGASMGILIINIILPALIGLVWWLVGRRKVGELVG
jgi:hypothetical protein